MKPPPSAGRRLAPLAAALGLLVVGPAAAVSPSAGCGQSPPSSGNKTVTVSGAPGGNRTYELQVPGAYDQDFPYPLLIGYHGSSFGSISVDGALFCGSNYGNLSATVGNDAVIVCPDDEGSGSVAWVEPSDISFFDAMLDDLASSLCVDRDKVFITGHSAGAAFANRVGCARGDVIRAIAPVAGFQSGSECSSPVGQVAVMVIQGEDDAFVSQSTGEALRDSWLPRNSCNGASPFSITPADCSTHQGYAGCDAGYPVEWCLEQNVDHLDYWSIPASFGGSPTNLAPPALWNFFTSLSDPLTPLLADDFEDDLAGWAAAVGDVSVSAQAAQSGSGGLEVGFGDLCSYPATDVTVSGPTTTGTTNACNSVATSGTVSVLGSATFNAGATVALADGFGTGLATFTASLEPAVVPFSYVEDTSPAALGNYHASWRVDADALSAIDSAMDFGHFNGYASDGTLLFRVGIRRHTAPSENRLTLEARSGGALVAHGSEFLLPAGGTPVEIHWSAGAGTGQLVISFDGGSTFSGLGGLANGGRALETVRLGLVDGEIGATGGYLSVDDFDSWH